MQIEICEEKYLRVINMQLKNNVEYFSLIFQNLKEQ